MCGIYGAVTWRERLCDTDAVLAMGARLRHRGPDGHGTLTSTDAVIGVERLRIVDLDPRADQPFRDPDDRVWLAANGEVYNARALRSRAYRYPYRSRSDIEPLVPLLRDRGADGIRDAIGMFAIAVWEPQRRRLLLARDRAGEKPLFWTRVGDEVWFASEIAALIGNPRVGRSLDPVALTDFLALGAIREPRTPFLAIRAVPAGAVMTFTEGGTDTEWYWHLDDRGLPRADEPEDVDRVRRALIDAVERQVTADVPVGVFTSGGLDSALISSLAVRARGPKAVQTFSVGFHQSDYDERPHAARLATALGTRHHDVLADEAALFRAYQVTADAGEPIADPAFLPTLLLAEQAREQVGVVLSGEGADELFGGYPTYSGHALADTWRRLPRPIRRLAASAVQAWPTSTGKVTTEYLLKRFVNDADRPWLERHVRWFGSTVPDSALRPAWRLEHLTDDPGVARDPRRAAMAFDTRVGLRERLLVKLDRATMRVALEARAPFLDPEVIASARAVHGDAHVRGLRTKRLLTRVASGLVPPFILSRRKRGLSVPIAGWLNGGFRTEADRLLGRERLDARPWLDAAAVTELLRAHRAGRADNARALWTLIALEHWIERWTPEVG